MKQTIRGLEVNPLYEPQIISQAYKQKVLADGLTIFMQPSFMNAFVCPVPRVCKYTNHYK
jgi:hypothetical protein